MSFILEAKNGQSVQINAWNWRPTLELLRNAKIIDDETSEKMGIHGHGRVDAETARRIAEFLDLKLKSMKPGERIRADLTVTAQPKKLAVFAPGGSEADIDAVELYSTTYEWLLKFRDFSRNSGGFEVF